MTKRVYWNVYIIPVYTDVASLLIGFWLECAVTHFLSVRRWVIYSNEHEDSFHFVTNIKWLFCSFHMN